jgi:hypothetical protein
MARPTGFYEDGAVLHRQILENIGIDCGSIRADLQAFEIDEAVERKRGKIFAIPVTMEGRIEVGAGVGHHVDSADVEFHAFRVVLTRILAREEIANRGSGQAGVGHRTVPDLVTQVNYHWF